MRGRPWRNSLIIMALLTRNFGYELEGRRARHAKRSIAQFVPGMERKTRVRINTASRNTGDSAHLIDDQVYTKM